ncbi:MAG: hemerythrin domain-containing protein [Acidobacteria bacterium]|nr:hemerythrin domain-containing protein [Acidobacteriota bacterium]
MTARPTHLLRHEHRVIEQALRALDGMCLRLKAGDDSPAGALLQALEFIRNYADRYHHFREEEYLFPALKQCGLEEGGALAFLCAEHVRERELLAELENALQTYRGGNSIAVEHFLEIADRFRQHLIEHMQQEDNLLFRLAEDMLDEEAKGELMQRLASGNDEALDAVNRKYERLAAELENAWII